MAWEKWQAVYQDLKFANRMGGGAIRRMLHRQLSMAWEQWQYMAAEMARQAMLVRRGLMRILHAKLAAALGTWRAVAAQMKAEREAMALERAAMKANHF